VALRFSPLALPYAFMLVLVPIPFAFVRVSDFVYVFLFVGISICEIFSFWLSVCAGAGCYFLRGREAPFL